MKETFFHILDYWQFGGPLLIPIALVCFGIWTYFFKTRRALLDILRLPEGFARSMDGHVAGGRRDELQQWMDTVPGVVPQSTAYALRSWGKGLDPLEIFDDCRAFVLSRVEKDFIVLAALTTVAPLLGLLGTVVGMVDTFQSAAEFVDPSTSGVAGGIGEALITTQIGLFVAIPGVMGVARLRRISEEVNAAFAQCRNHLLALKKLEQKWANEGRDPGAPPRSPAPLYRPQVVRPTA